VIISRNEKRFKKTAEKKAAVPAPKKMMAAMRRQK
jgi:hypothetical protein